MGSLGQRLLLPILVSIRALRKRLCDAMQSSGRSAGPGLVEQPRCDQRLAYSGSV